MYFPTLMTKANGLVEWHINGYTSSSWTHVDDRLQHSTKLSNQGKDGIQAGELAFGNDSMPGHMLTHLP